MFCGFASASRESVNLEVFERMLPLYVTGEEGPDYATAWREAVAQTQLAA